MPRSTAEAYYGVQLATEDAVARFAKELNKELKKELKKEGTTGHTWRNDLALAIETEVKMYCDLQNLKTPIYVRIVDDTNHIIIGALIARTIACRGASSHININHHTIQSIHTLASQYAPLKNTNPTLYIFTNPSC
jgi:hypothetical protein